MEAKVEKVVSHFLSGKPSEIQRLEGGHINRTFLVTQDTRYICQQLKGSLFEGRWDMLEDNYRKLRLAYDKAKDRISDWIIPKWVLCREGGYLYRDTDGSIWRVYRYIDGEVKSRIETYEQAVCVGEGLAKLHGILAAFSDLPKSAILHFHEPEWYYKEYRFLDGKTVKRDQWLDELIKENAEKFIALKLPTRQAIHGDAKLSNAVFSGDKLISFIDMDTLMPGNVLTDLAECIRSCCIRDGKLDDALYRGILSGYQKFHGALTEEELKLLPLVVQKLCFELGLRYYTDALSGNAYFMENYPGENLEKAKRYLEFSVMTEG